MVHGVGELQNGVGLVEEEVDPVLLVDHLALLEVYSQLEQEAPNLVAYLPLHVLLVLDEGVAAPVANQLGNAALELEGELLLLDLLVHPDGDLVQLQNLILGDLGLALVTGQVLEQPGDQRILLEAAFDPLDFSHSVDHGPDGANQVLFQRLGQLVRGRDRLQELLGHHEGLHDRNSFERLGVEAEDVDQSQQLGLVFLILEVLEVLGPDGGVNVVLEDVEVVGEELGNALDEGDRLAEVELLDVQLVRLQTFERPLGRLLLDQGQVLEHLEIAEQLIWSHAHGHELHGVVAALVEGLGGQMVDLVEVQELELLLELLDIEHALHDLLSVPRVLVVEPLDRPDELVDHLLEEHDLVVDVLGHQLVVLDQVGDHEGVLEAVRPDVEVHIPLEQLLLELGRGGHLLLDDKLDQPVDVPELEPAELVEVGEVADDLLRHVVHLDEATNQQARVSVKVLVDVLNHGLFNVAEGSRHPEGPIDLGEGNGRHQRVYRVEVQEVGVGAHILHYFVLNCDQGFLGRLELSLQLLLITRLLKQLLPDNVGLLQHYEVHLKVLKLRGGRPHHQVVSKLEVPQLFNGPHPVELSGSLSVVEDFGDLSVALRDGDHRLEGRAILAIFIVLCFLFVLLSLMAGGQSKLILFPLLLLHATH
mmetsp:Transcript_14425/g.24609  ORF Transcript_14425/g.24609 Transcript_14425/m.24609 type:complete len:647 (-) Transcript_14425:181-2121(-)